MQYLQTFNNVLNALFGLLFGPYLQEMGMNTTQISLILNLSIVVVNLSGNFIILKEKFEYYPKYTHMCFVKMIVSFYTKRVSEFFGEGQ